jgi:cyanophycinase
MNAPTQTLPIPRLPVFVTLASLVACVPDAASQASTGVGGASATASAGTGGSGGGGGPSGAGGGSGGMNAERPMDLEAYLVGDDADADVAPMGPAWIVMGGGPDVDEAFARWIPLVQGGDVVVLRTSGADGYNDYLFDTIGGVDSVETLLVTTRALADSDYVAERLARAEAVFLAGGDQAEYLAAWKGTRVEDELRLAAGRGAVVGGTSAGAAVLGEFVYSAVAGTVYSDEALGDPYNAYMTFEREFLDYEVLRGVIVDTHFAARDRMGRLLAFVARPIADGWAESLVGLGIDEGTALWIDAAGSGTVLGDGAVYVVRSNGSPAQCEPGLPLEYADLSLAKLTAGDTVALPNGSTGVSASPVSASGGVTVPASPY